MKNKRILFIFTLVFILVFSNTALAAPASDTPQSTTAETEPSTEQNEGDTPTPYWQNTSSTAISLTFSNKTATCFASISGNTNVNKITVTAALAKKNSSGKYVNVKSWGADTNYADWYQFTQFVSNCSSGDYRLTVVAQVYVPSSSSPEIVTLISENSL